MSLRTNFLTDAMLTASYIGSTISVTLIAVTALVFFQFRKLRSARRVLLCSCIGSILLIRSAKAFFGRVRPDPDTWLAPATGLSFPSGHSAGSFAVLGAIFFILGSACEQKYQRFAVWFIGFSIVLAIGFSRVYLGVHYPTDVFGGFLLGLAILLLSISVDRYVCWRQSRERSEGAQ